MRTIASVLFLISTLTLAGGSDWIVVLHSEENTVSFIDSETKVLKASVPISVQTPQHMFPAPSGRYLFITSQSSGTVSVVDTEEHREVKTISLTSTPPGSLSFSPMGDWLYVTEPGSENIATYQHSRLDFDPENGFAAGKAGAPVTFNRRGTRVYRSSSSGLAIVYVKTKELIREVPFSHGRMIWAFAPDFRFLWGVGLDNGVVVVIDENKYRVAKVLDIPARAQAAVFEPEGRNVFFMDRNGESIVVVDRRSYKTVNRFSLPFSADSFAYTGKGVLWIGASDRKQVLALESRSGKVLQQIELSGKASQIRHLSLKTGDGYACF